jgi:hypothetical protein
MNSNENNFLGPVAACWAPGASVEVFLRLGVHFGVPRCVASGPTTENMPPKTFFKNSTRKNFRVTRWRGRVGVGLHEVASRKATYHVLSGFETETETSRHGINYVYRTSIVFKEARSPQEQGHLSYSVLCDTFEAGWSTTRLTAQEALSAWMHYLGGKTQPLTGQMSPYEFFGLVGECFYVVPGQTQPRAAGRGTDVQSEMCKYAVNVDDAVALSTSDVNDLKLFRQIFTGVLNPGTMGRPPENLRKMKDALLTMTCATCDAVDAEFLQRNAGGTAGASRWTKHLEAARARAAANADADAKDLKYWDPTTRRYPRLPPDIKASAAEFWKSDHVSRQLPSNVQKDGPDGEPRYGLLVTPAEAHVLFVKDMQKSNADFHCSLKWFKYQRPKTIVKNKRDYSLCVYHLRDFHVNDALFRLMKNVHRKTNGFGMAQPARCDCNCMDTIKTTAAFRDRLRCPRVNVTVNPAMAPLQLAPPSCHAGGCTECPDLPGLGCPFMTRVLEGEEQLDIKYMRSVRERDSAGGSKIKGRDAFVGATMPFTDFYKFEYEGFCKSKQFMQHRYEAGWQRGAHDFMQQQLQPGTVIAAVDLSMNWAEEGNMDPSQSFFNPLSATLMPVVLTLHLNNLNKEAFEQEFPGVLKKHQEYMLQQPHLNANIIRITLMFISEDKTHDTSLVSYAVDKTMDWLQKYTINIHKVEWWSDGCRVRLYASTQLATEVPGSATLTHAHTFTSQAQFKCRNHLGNMSRTSRGFKIFWNFHCSCHVRTHARTHASAHTVF